MEMLDDARDLGMLVQVNTSLMRRNVAQLDAMAALLATTGIAVWSVFFLVPVGRGLSEPRISPAEYETVFAQLYEHGQRQPYRVKTVEAPHYRRFILQRGGNPFGWTASGPRPWPSRTAGHYRWQGDHVRRSHGRHFPGRFPARGLRPVSQ